jgi:hypothetical protein
MGTERKRSGCAELPPSTTILGLGTPPARPTRGTRCTSFPTTNVETPMDLVTNALRCRLEQHGSGREHGYPQINGRGRCVLARRRWAGFPMARGNLKQIPRSAKSRLATLQPQGTRAAYGRRPARRSASFADVHRPVNGSPGELHVIRRAASASPRRVPVMKAIR